MILSSLNDLYYRLLGQYDESGSRVKCLVPSYGFSDEKVGFLLVLDENGELKDVESNIVEITKGKKIQSEDRRMRLPCAFGRSGKFTEKAFSEGKNIAFFLWDKPEFLLGVKLNGTTVAKSELPFRAFKARQQQLIGVSEDKGLNAVLKFLEKWEPDKFETHPLFKQKMLKSNFAFKLDGDLGIVAEREAAIRIWKHHWEGQRNTVVRQCLVTGDVGSLAETHTLLKISGGQTSGVAIVTYNEDAYESFGKTQGDNAPVSELAAFAYTTTLNYLLRRENGHCLTIGDTSTVFWAVAAEATKASSAESLFGWMLNMPADDASQMAQLKPVLEKIAQGKPLIEIAPNLAEGTRFYVLGLAPNASRLSIRYWMDTSFGQLAENLSQHWRDLALEPSPWQRPPSVSSLLIELVPNRKKDGKFLKRTFNDIPPQLAGEFFRAVLNKSPYPASVLAKLIDRMRSDGDINGHRVAMVKAILNRNFSHQFERNTLMALDKDHPNVAYQLGCQFALFERAQYAALGNLNASVKDKFFGAASASPRTAFASLYRNFNHHVADLRKGKKAVKWKGNPQKMAMWLEKRTGEISNKLTGTYPAHLSLVDQGLFVLGYYHQRFIPKSKDPELAQAQLDEPDDADLVVEQNQEDAE